jgi:hypothetical protein
MQYRAVGTWGARGASPPKMLAYQSVGGGADYTHYIILVVPAELSDLPTALQCYVKNHGKRASLE